MSRSGSARACALLALLTILATGCGSDDTAGTTTTTTTTVAGDPSSSASTTTSTTIDPTPVIEVAYAGGSVVGGARTEKVKLGTKVRLRVTSDVADEVHVHTYDIVSDIAPGQTVTLDVAATIPGRHEVELEKLGKPLLILEVS